MKTKILPLHRRMVAGMMFFLFTLNLFANPTGLTVTSGSATAQSNGSQLTVTAGNNANLNWQSFNIGAGEKTVFVQPAANSIVFNHIGGQSASQIYGSLQANGVVVLLNSSGFYFGPNSFVSAAGLVVSTANCAPPQNAGGMWQFNGPPPLASIVNYGQIKIGDGGYCYLIADQVENHGSITAPGGNIGLAAGQTVTLSERADGRGMSMEVQLPQGSVDNVGNIIADGGTIALNAKVVNQNGFIQANSVKQVNGVIELVADDALSLGADSQISAAGDDSIGGSAGGSVTLKSGNTFSDADGGQIVTTGGAQGGNGGNIEVSAPNIQSLASAMDASAQNGFLGGTFLLDPVNIILGTSGSGAVPASGTVASGSTTGTDSHGNLLLNVNTAFANKNFSQILLQATGNIYVGNGTVNASSGNFSFSSSPAITWNLSSSTGNSSGQLTLQAGGNINFGNNSKIMDANGWSVSLAAGYNFANNSVSPGTGSTTVGNINFSGGSSLQTAAGNINLFAGQNITIGSGFVRTSNGGSVIAQALTGNINTGTATTGYTFGIPSAANPALFTVNSGGISTEAGGDVTITAGGNVTSYLPSSSVTTDAGSGAFGTQAGNVTVTAGGNVTGHYVVANGTGVIKAGANAGTANAKLALSLAAGGWTVNAGQDINLQEVRNPNGVFNDASTFLLPASYHYFNYAPDAYVNLNAGNAVVLGDSSAALPRIGIEIPFIYAPILNIVAGAGGVSLTGDGDPFNKLILFPSPQGSLTITTTGGGLLTSTLPNNSDGSPSLFNLIVSDSGQNQYVNANADTFGLDDHAATPVHLNHETPVTLNISGDMDNILLSAPEAAQINVVGDMNNSRFQGMNLSGNDVTSINVGQSAKQNLETAGILTAATDGGLRVGGDIVNRNDFTTATADAPPNLAYLSQAYPANSVAANLAKQLSYNSVTKQLTIQGPVTAQVLAVLQSLQIQVYQNGMPQVDGLGNPILQTVSIIDAATATALQNAYAQAGPIPSTRDSGYILGGGGKFQINAQNIDLGTTLGIQSQGVSYDTYVTSDANGNRVINYPLANFLNSGASIEINASQDLDLFSTAISTVNGGDITIHAGGGVNIGATAFIGSSATARGIFSTGVGDVTVIAGDDINVNGSRIAAYDGGNVTVESLNGNINAGSGGVGSVGVSAFKVDPVTHQVSSYVATIPGSGILATTFPTSVGKVVGNILVETPHGDINANVGGITQLPLNGNNSSLPLVEILAGYELRDNAGNPVFAKNINSGTPVAVVDAQNIVTFGSTVPASVVTTTIVNGQPHQTVTPVTLSRLLDASGNPMLDASGNQLYVQLIPGNGTTTSDLFRVVECDAQNVVQSYLNPSGNAVNIATQDSSKNPYHDAAGNPVMLLGRNINVSGSGVIGQNVTLKATGQAQGNIFSRYAVVLDAQQLGPTTVFGKTIDSKGQSDGPTILIGTDKVTTDGGGDQTILSQNANGQNSIKQGTAANSTSQAASAQTANDTAVDKSGTGTDDELDKKGKDKKPISLAQKVSRVTVLLPKPD